MSTGKSLVFCPLSAAHAGCSGAIPSSAVPIPCCDMRGTCHLQRGNPIIRCADTVLRYARNMPDAAWPSYRPLCRYRAAICAGHATCSGAIPSSAVPIPCCDLRGACRMERGNSIVRCAETVLRSARNMPHAAIPFAPRPCRFTAARPWKAYPFRYRQTPCAGRFCRRASRIHAPTA